jgi:general stress protein 26
MKKGADKQVKQASGARKGAEKKGAEKKGTDDQVSTGKKLGDLYELIEGMEVCMMTTRRFDGRLVSRAMQVQDRKQGTADLWFVTSSETHKLDELEAQPEVNLAFYNSKSREWVSVSGAATVMRNRDKIRELYKPDWKIWFGDEGGERNGGPNDPRIMLIFVEAHTVEYLKQDKPKPFILFEIARSLVTGKQAELGDQRMLTERELPHDAYTDAR